MKRQELAFRVQNSAKELGNRITYILPGETKEKTLWAGLGNRSGLHSFAYTLIREKWEASGERMLKKLDKLPSGTSVFVSEYQNTTRDRGSWVRTGKAMIE